MCRSSTQCAERVADRENLVRELCEALRRAANSAGFQYMTLETRDAIDAALARAKDQQGE